MMSRQRSSVRFVDISPLPIVCSLRENRITLWKYQSGSGCRIFHAIKKAFAVVGANAPGRPKPERPILVCSNIRHLDVLQPLRRSKLGECLAVEACNASGKHADPQ